MQSFKPIFFALIILVSAHLNAQHTAANARAAKLKKGMNLAVWLESSYWYFNTTTFPDVNRYTEADIRNLHDLCFDAVRLPVFFEPFAGTAPPYTFNTGNGNIARGLAYVDSAIAWTGKYGMTLVIDNHLADDDNSNNLQSNYQLTDANYNAQAAQMCAVWKQVIARYGYADPDRVLFELRNEPNTISDANLRKVYQAMLDTIRRYDHSHTLIVGKTGYYDAVSLANSAPYTDTNIIYTFHIYDGNSHPGFCFQGQGGVPATDSLSGNHVSFARNGAQAADITTEVQNVKTWSTANSVPVWLGEFGCTTLASVYGDDTSRCNYVSNFGAVLDATQIPWCYWDGYGPDEYVTSYDGGTTLTYLFSIFDRSNVLTASHLDPCFASALHIAGSCVTGISDITAAGMISLYPNPSHMTLHITAPQRFTAIVYTSLGQQIESFTSVRAEADISTVTYPAGIYIIETTLSDGRKVTGRFVKE